MSESDFFDLFDSACDGLSLDQISNLTWLPVSLYDCYTDPVMFHDWGVRN